MNTSQQGGAGQAVRTAGALHRLLKELFELSVRQMELLDRHDLELFEEVIERKAVILEVLPRALQTARDLGWSLEDPATFPIAEPCASYLYGAADLARRLQAHERYCLGQTIARRRQIGDRLALLSERRHAAAGYRVPRTRGSAVDLKAH
jgi:hypothetical protein